MDRKKKICVLGLGYIGLPSAALLANRGYEVHGVDVLPAVVDTINQGRIHIVEPGLDTFVQSAVKSGRLTAHTTPAEADIFIIAVPTPFKDGHIPNLDYVIESTRAIASFVQPGNIIILESTSPVGTTEMIGKILREENIDTDRVCIAHCPERVLPGRIMIELVENDRIVGGINRESTEAVAAFYQDLITGKVLQTDARTAEMCKLVENSARDVNIAFANELSILCDRLDINVWELIALANHHPRINILMPGPGVGGHCIAVDPWFIIHAGEGDARIIQTAREVNTYKTRWVIEKIHNDILTFEKENGKMPVVACMGLAFKPNIDDLRESPSLEIVRSLKEKGVSLCVVEPHIDSHPEFDIINVDEAVCRADIVVFLVAHDDFYDLETSDKRVLDFCGVQNEVY